MDTETASIVASKVDSASTMRSPRPPISESTVIAQDLSISISIWLVCTSSLAWHRITENRLAPCRCSCDYSKPEGRLSMSMTLQSPSSQHSKGRRPLITTSNSSYSSYTSLPSSHSISTIHPHHDFTKCSPTRNYRALLLYPSRCLSHFTCAWRHHYRSESGD